MVKKKNTKKKPATANQEVFELPAVMDISFATKFLDSLSETMSRVSTGFIIDGSQVVRLTTPCVQILLCASNKLIKEDGVLSIKSPSDVMVQVFADLGLSNELNQWSK